MEKLRITVNGRIYEVMVEVLGAEEGNSAEKTAFPSAGQPLTSINGGKPASAPPKSDPACSAGVKSLKSPMPGTVMDIKVKPGETVKQGQVLVALEAMKMINDLVAESDALVKEIHVSTGQSVQAEELLISLA